MSAIRAGVVRAFAAIRSRTGSGGAGSGEPSRITMLSVPATASAARAARSIEGIEFLLREGDSHRAAIPRLGSAQGGERQLAGQERRSFPAARGRRAAGVS